MSDVGIPDFLASLGLTGTDAERARAALEAERITNPRKTRLSAGKLEAARAAIDDRFARFCASCAGRTDPGGREVVVVATASCTRCGGSRNDRALAEMVEACDSAGLRRIVVVGGSPDVRRELAAAGGPELKLVDGTARRTKPEALRDLAWGDLVVICGSSELAHKVSNLYKGDTGPTPVVTAPRRSVEAIAGAVVEHVRKR